MTTGRTLDVSNVNFTAPDIKRFCKGPKSHADASCKDPQPCVKSYYEAATVAIEQAVKQLRDLVEGANGVKGNYCVGEELVRGLEDICRDLPNTTVMMNSTEQVTQAFAKLTACRDRIGQTTFTSLHETAKERCISVSLTDRGDGSASAALIMPVGGDFKNCLKFTVPLDGYSKLIDVRLPDGYKVDNPNFVDRGWEGNLRAYRLTDYNPGRRSTAIFQVKIVEERGGGGEGTQLQSRDILVQLVSIDIPALR